MNLALPRLSSLLEVVRLFRATASGYVKRRLALVLALMVVSSAVTTLAPVALKFIVDGLTGHGSRKTVFTLIALYILSQLLVRVISELRTLIQGQADRRMYRRLSDQLFAHVMNLPLRYHLDRQTGAVNETLTNGLQGYQLVMQTVIHTLLPTLIQLSVVATVLVNLDQPVFITLFLFASLCYSLTFGYGAIRVTKAARGASAAQIAARALMTDSILNYETVKYFTAESVVRDRLDSALGGTESKWLNFYRSRTLNGLIVATIFATFLGATVLYAAKEVLSGRMTIGDFVLVNAYMLQLAMPLEQIGYSMQQLSQATAFLEKMLELLRQEPEERVMAALAGGATDTRVTDVPGALTFERVRASYRTGHAVLAGVSFKVARGKTLGIVGASGAGKSTMVRLMVRLIEPEDGRILLDGIPITEFSLATLRQAIAVVPQDTVLFNDTIGYNIGFGKPGSSQNEIEEAARVANMHELVRNLPDGYGTLVGERGLKLSGGERQRVSIARAALKRPRIYIFDEATSSLDSRTEQEILANLRELSRHATTLVIAHRLTTVMHADEIVVLHDGVIVELGDHASLLASNGRYTALWWAQQRHTDATLASAAV